MLTFFRRIRKGLLEGGRTSKYLLYAIGEIALVVIGILIALQINIWNQSRLNSTEEQKILYAISEKMRHNRFQHMTGTERYGDVITAAERLLMIMHNSSINVPQVEIDQNIHTLTKRFLFGKSNSTTIYDELIGAGQLGLVTSRDLRSLLTSLKQNMELLASYEELQNSFVDHELSPFLSRNIDQVSVSKNGSKADSSSLDKLLELDYSVLKRGYFATSYDDLLGNREFSNLLMDLIKHSNVLLPIYKRIGLNISQIDSIVNVENPALKLETSGSLD